MTIVPMKVTLNSGSGAIEIRFSDVASSYVEAGNSYFFATITPKS